ncbi:MAG: lipid ABC transporter permease/ATP-binding protein, partial [Luminiphilus sp.]
MKTETGKPSDWALYRRLLGYVARHGGAFSLSILGFLIYSLANVLLADLTQFLLDSLGEASQISMGFVSNAAHWLWPPGDKGPVEYARIAVPAAAIVCALIRAS